jgi:hypothetical protein
VFPDGDEGSERARPCGRDVFMGEPDLDFALHAGSDVRRSPMTARRRPRIDEAKGDLIGKGVDGRRD